MPGAPGTFGSSGAVQRFRRTRSRGAAPRRPPPVNVAHEIAIPMLPGMIDSIEADVPSRPPSNLQE